MKNNKPNLEDKLVDFAVSILNLAEKLPNTYAGKHLSQQIIRSGTSPALNYGEAQAAESRSDFIHKMKVALKELRETYINLKIIYKKQFINSENIKPVAQENNELISIFIASINTANKKRKNN